MESGEGREGWEKGREESGGEGKGKRGEWGRGKREKGRVGKRRKRGEIGKERAGVGGWKKGKGRRRECG